MTPLYDKLIGAPTGEALTKEEVEKIKALATKVRDDIIKFAETDNERYDKMYRLLYASMANFQQLKGNKAAIDNVEVIAFALFGEMNMNVEATLAFVVAIRLMLGIEEEGAAADSGAAAGSGGKGADGGAKG